MQNDEAEVGPDAAASEDDQVARPADPWIETARTRASAEAKRFIKSLSLGSDLVIQVLRLHLLFEHHLERLITSGLPRGDRLISSRMKFSQKLQIVHALDILSDGTIGALQGLNRVRNDCAHQLIIAAGTLHYGMARMIQILHELADDTYPAWIVRNEAQLENTLQELSRREF